MLHLFETPAATSLFMVRMDTIRAGGYLLQQLEALPFKARSIIEIKSCMFLIKNTTIIVSSRFFFILDDSQKGLFVIDDLNKSAHLPTLVEGQIFFF